MKFACDVMLGRLARWLRAGGHDVFYQRDIDRSALLRVAREQGRTVLTRAQNYRELAEIPPYLILTGDDLDGWLTQVYQAFPDLDPNRGFLSRCMECNALLEKVDKEAYKDKIPPKAMLLTGRFSRCPSCHKLLWPGTHVERIKARFGRVLPGRFRA